MKRFTLLLSSMLFVANLNAQEISGLVIDKTNAPVEIATIVMQTPDSVYINSAVTDSMGRFLIHYNTEISTYRLIVQHLLYETFENVYSNRNELIIQLEEKANVLGEVTVRGERPLVKLVDGKISYDIPRMISGKVVSNAYESMLQLPGVSEQSGMITLAGASSVTVIINGKVTSMPYESLMSVLKMYPADNIQSAEVMYSAPPQYHIRGAAINLVMKDADSDNSFQGQVTGNYTQKHYANHSEGVSILFATPKLSADVNYAYSLNHSKSDHDIISNHFLNGNINNIEQFNRGDSKNNTHHFRMETDYNFSDKNTVNLTYTSLVTPNIDNNEASSGTFSNSVSHKEESSPRQLHNISLNFLSASNFKTGLEYTYYKDLEIQSFREVMTGKETAFTANASQQINRYRVFVDKSHALPKDWKLNYGAQYMYAMDKSAQTYYSEVNESISASNMDSRQKEYTTNAYLGFEKNIGERLSVAAAVTPEYYKLGNYDEWTIFPSLEATYLISPSHMMQFSFSSDKVYADYWELHGSVGYLNSYAEIHGNPLLKPYKDYSVQMSYILKNKYIITLFHNYQDDYFCQLPYQAQDRLSLIYKTLNFDYKQKTGINLIIPFNIGNILSSRMTINGFYDKVKASHFHDISFEKDKFAFYSRLDNTINISSNPDIKAEISGAYITKNIQGPAELSTMWNTDVGMKWTFFDGLAELRIKGTDLFNSWSPDLIMKYKTQDSRLNMIPDSRSISMSFTFKFGGYDKSHEDVNTSRFRTK